MIDRAVGWDATFPRFYRPTCLEAGNNRMWGALAGRRDEERDDCECMKNKQVIV